MKWILELKQIEESLRQECEANIKERAKRYQQVKPHGIIAATHFAPVSAEIPLIPQVTPYYY